MRGRHFVRALATLAVVTAAQPLSAQEPTVVRGRVTSDAGGMPIAGANVFLQRARAGTVTDDSGRFTVTVPAARATGQTDTLTVRRIGYRFEARAVTLQAGQTITEDFTLSTNPLRLGEVVVTGAGTATTRERLGNVINSVDSTALTRANEPNIVQALSGKAPNVEVTQQSGDPGASSFVRIRGAKTISGSGEPLIVVDGVPIDNTTISTGSFLASTVTPNRASDIDPQDVQSVEILKGAAAAAIYGARAANGVVLITTKRGQAGQTRWTLNSSFSADQVNRDVPLQQRFGQGDNGEAATCATPGCLLTPNSYGAELSGVPTYDHFDEIFSTGFLQDHNLSVSGGTERTLFYLSGGVLDHDGVIVGPNNEYNKVNGRLRASHRLRDDLEIGGNINYIDTRGNFVQKGSNISGLMLGALRTPPNFDNSEYIDPETGLHRSYRYPQPVAFAVGRGYDNPFWVVNEHVNEQNVNRTVGSLNIDWNPLDWLDVRYTLGTDYYTDRRLEGLPVSSSDRPLGRVISADFANRTIDHNLTGTARAQLTGNISGTFTVGQNLNTRRFRQLYVTGFDLVAPGLYQLDNTVTKDPDEFLSQVNVEAYFGQAEFAFGEDLFVTLAARNDGFSTFGSSQRRHWFPKASVAWNFSEMLNRDGEDGVLTFGKLRAAYGQTGRAPEPYTTIQGYSIGNLFDAGWGPTLTPVYAGRGGLYSSEVLAQQDIGPERTNEFEGGVDLAFLQNRVDLSLTYYNARSEDVIFQSPLSPSSGYTVQARNAATIRNTGFEGQLNYRPIMTGDLTWEVGAIFATNRNKVLDLQGAQFVDMPGAFAGAPGAAVLG